MKPTFLICAALFILNGCATIVGNDQIDQALNAASNCPENSRLGYCVRDKFDMYAPNWPQLSKSKYLVALFSYLNAAGKRLDEGEWSRTQFDDETKSFMIALQQAMADEDRRNSAVAWKNFNKQLRDISERQERMARRMILKSPVTCNFNSNSMTCW